MGLLNRGLNLLVRDLNRPSNVLHIAFSSFVRDSKNCRPFLPNQSLFFTTTNCSVCGVWYVDKMLFTSNQNVLSSLYLLSTSQLNIGCFMAGLSILGPAMLCGLSAVAAVIACIATLVTSTTVLAIASLTITCSLAILLLFFLYFCLTKTLLLTPCNALVTNYIMMDVLVVLTWLLS